MKLLAALFVLMLAIALASFWVWRRSPEAAPCSSHEIEGSLSPDGRAQADLFEVRCADTLTTHVALRSKDAPQAARSDVFIARGSVPVRLRWTGARELTVQSGAEQIFVQEGRWRDVAVIQRRAP